MRKLMFAPRNYIPCSLLPPRFIQKEKKKKKEKRHRSRPKREVISHMVQVDNELVFFLPFSICHIHFSASVSP